MKIIHNNSERYVQNQLFSNQNHTDEDYSTFKKQSKKNMGNLKLKNKSTPFNDLTNLSTKKLDNQNIQDNIQNDKKQINQLVYFQQEFVDQISENLENSCFKNQKKKTKKKVSPKKNNFRRLLMDDFDEKSDTEQKKQSNETIKIKIQNSEDKQFKKVSSSQKVNLESKDEQNFISNKKFNFLYNEINFESSDEQVNHKRSSSSENDSQGKVYFQLSKPKNNIILDDNQFDDSCSQDLQKSSDQKQKTTDSPKQQSSNKSVKTNSKQNIYITTTDFIRNYINQGEEYLKKPLPENKYIEFIMKRDKSKKRTDSIEYYLYDSKLIKQILYIEKTNKYSIYAKENVQNPRAHPDLKYLTGQLEVNFLGNIFSLKEVNKKTNEKRISQTISYEMNLLGLNGPRKINVYIPEDSKMKINHEKNLEQIYNIKNQNCPILRFCNKQAKWNNQVSSYVLNMKGKAKLSSVKNFVIVKSVQNELQRQTQEQKNRVIFGKVDRDRFNLVIGGPFSILQGLSIALSTFDRKFACE